MSSLPGQTSPRVPWWYPTPRKLAIVSLALVVIGVVAWGVWRATHCAPGVRRLGGECVGVTDGGFVFAPELALVMGKIHEENRWVLAQEDRPSVSIAYLVPLPAQTNDLSEVLRHELQGAYVAQRRANHTSELGDRPLIRLLVANAGEGNEQWRPVVDQLLSMVETDRLVAVAGFGTSLETTRQAIKALTGKRIPTVTARLTADDLSGGDPGFARVAPTNRDQVEAAVAALKRDAGVRRALLVQDINSGDPFSRTLGEAFAAEFPDATHTLLQPVERYDASIPGLANRFLQMMASICQQRPDIIFFAGRGDDLEDFVEALPGRPCQDFPVSLMTGDSGARTAIVLRQQLDERDEALRDGLESNVTLRYTAQAHPGSWAAAMGSFSRDPIHYFQQSCANPACFTILFPGEPLDDGAAVVGHDAVVTAMRAVRLAVGEGRDLDGDPVIPGEVIQQLNGFHGSFAVPGASGWISLDGNGDPVDKAVAILELKPDGTVAFVELSSPDGDQAPFRPPSLPPAGARSWPSGAALRAGRGHYGGHDGQIAEWSQATYL